MTAHTVTVKSEAKRASSEVQLRSLLFAHHTSRRRRALVAVQVGVMLFVLLGMAALTIDVGTLYNARGDLQRTSDAAALAGASVYATDAMMRIRMGTAGSDTVASVISLASSRVGQFAGLNPTFGTTYSNVNPGDILTGWMDLYSASASIQLNPLPRNLNAVQVTVRREAGGEEGANEPVQFFFAPIFGRLVGEASATAVAVFDDRVSTIATSVPGAGILPFTIHENAFASELAAGGDSYSYNESSDTVTRASDGIREIRLYPYPLSGSGYTEGDGNFGVLNIGTGNQGLEAERQQILNGITPYDLELEIGTSDLTFYDDDGNPVTYDITGSPGLEASLKSTVSQIIGHVVGFFLHDNVVLSGSNATYTITQIRYGRVMAIRLTGSPNQRGLFVQPVSYTGGEIRIDPQAPSTGGLVGRLVLSR